MIAQPRLRTAARLPALAGAALAVWLFLSERGLWLDEASLGLNLLERSAAGLLRPLDHGQAAPLLYLLAAKAAATVMGPSALSLRLPSLLAFLLTVTLFDGILRRTLRTPAARIVGMSLLCFNLMLLRYSGELKQYMTETMVCVWITALVIRYLDRGGLRPLPLLAAGLLGILLSHTAAQVLVMAGCMMLVQGARTRDPRILRAALACGLCWLAALAGYYLLYVRGHPAQAFFMQYWERAGGFGPDDPFGPASARYLARKLELMRNAKNIFHVPVRWVNLTLLLVPLAAWLAGTAPRSRHLLLLPLPLVLHLLLSYRHVYPFDIRLTLYLLPLAILALAFGLDRMLLAAGLGGNRAGWLAIALCLWQGDVFRRRHLPVRSEELKPVAEAVSRRIRPGERLWMNPDARYAFRFHILTEAFAFDSSQVLTGRPPLGATGSYAEQVAALDADTWVLLTHLKEGEVRHLLGELTAHGLRVTDSIHAHQAWAYRLTHRP
jgi:4-amino-4-deoxy-L-arabinose transferase-like glycosyltransferase